jgi:hypothetical protein
MRQAGDLADPGEKALGGRAAAGVGADAAGRRPEAILSRLIGAATNAKIQQN